MARPITLFTGQWADLPFEEVCRLASDWGYDGLEIACWGDHLDVVRAVAGRAAAVVAGVVVVVGDQPRPPAEHREGLHRCQR